MVLRPSTITVWPRRARRIWTLRSHFMPLAGSAAAIQTRFIRKALESQLPTPQFAKLRVTEKR
ncbi:MAG: hypothetical protein ACI9F9_001104 [Candidatus Paceibacteria bacterium]|jgi:hypothetical protein